MTDVLDDPRPAGGTRWRTKHGVVKALLGCGIAYPVVYVATNDALAARRYQGYSRVDQAVSEMSATGAPTRRFLVALLPVYTGLTVAYGVGVWNAAAGRRAYVEPAQCCSPPVPPVSRGCHSRCPLGTLSPPDKERATTLAISS